MTGTSEHLRLPLGENATGKGLLLTTLALLAIGVVMVHSATSTVTTTTHWLARVEVRHTMYAVLAVAVMVLLWRVDYHRLASGPRFPVWAAVLLGVSLLCAAVILIPGVGYAVNDKVRWLRIGRPPYSIQFQPSELIKLTLVIFLAAWLTRPGVNVRSFWKTFVPAMALVGLCAALTVKNDFGSAGIIAFAACVTLLFAGIPLMYFLLLIPPAAGAVWMFVVNDPHRWQRIEAMRHPFADTAGAYQVRQSLLAVVTGGWTGQGLGNGVQKLGFLPEDSTDFIYAVFSEEWGLLGAVLLMGLLALWMWLVRRTAVRAGDRFGQVLAGSLGFLIALQAVLHIAVDLVAVPPTGMGLPFISAGGTALVLASAAVAMIVSISAHPSPMDTLQT